MFDLNVEAMSRERLEAAYFDAVFAYEQVAGQKLDEDVLTAQANLGVTPAEARVLSSLITSTPRSKAALLMVASTEPAAEPTMKLVEVYICKLRKKLRKIDVKIKTIWGHGYQMESAEVAKFRRRVNQIVNLTDYSEPTLKRHCSRWTARDLKFLNDNWRVLSDEEISQAINRTIPAIKYKRVRGGMLRNANLRKEPA